MLIQQAMIERLRRLCQGDERLVSAMLYGSFTYSQADQFSDVECLFFFEDGALQDIDPRAWVSQIAPVELYFVNEWGVGMAIFENLVRGEFHFESISDLAAMAESWQGNVWFPSLEATVLVDRNGDLTRCLQPLIGSPPARDEPESVQHVVNCFINWMLFGSNVLTRGELARALELLGWAQRYLLWMARLEERTTEHWPIPSRALEEDISAPAYARYVACASKLDREDLCAAYLAAWTWGKEMMLSLAARYEIAVHGPLVAKLDSLFLERHQMSLV